MDLNQNTLNLAESYIERKEKLGYALVKTKIDDWLSQKGVGYGYLASKLHMKRQTLSYMLSNNILFNKWQLKKIINELGARKAFTVIRFASEQQKQEVYWNAFGKYEEAKRNGYKKS